jgi:hypothetical protein
MPYAREWPRTLRAGWPLCTDATHLATRRWCWAPPQRPSSGRARSRASRAMAQLVPRASPPRRGRCRCCSPPRSSTREPTTAPRTRASWRTSGVVDARRSLHNQTAHLHERCGSGKTAEGLVGLCLCRAGICDRLLRSIFNLTVKLDPKLDPPDCATGGPSRLASSSPEMGLLDWVYGRGSRLQEVVIRSAGERYARALREAADHRFKRRGRGQKGLLKKACKTCVFGHAKRANAMRGPGLKSAHGLPLQA